MRKALIEENRLRKLQNLNESQGLDVVSRSGDSSAAAPESVDTASAESSSDLLDFLETEVFDEKEVLSEIMRIENYISSNNMTNVCETVFEKVAELEMTVLPIPRVDISFKFNFNEMEGHKLTELCEAIKLMRHPADRVDFQDVPNNYSGAVHILHSSCDQEIKDVIKMCKTLNAFRGLPESDQIVLLKYASLEIIVIQMILKFDFDGQFWDIITVCVEI